MSVLFQLCRSKPYVYSCYRQPFPCTRFIGIRYTDSDRVCGTFDVYWREWQQADRFPLLRKLLTNAFLQEYPKGNCIVALQKMPIHKTEENHFEYWIGMFLPKDSTVPFGFEYMDFSCAYVGICGLQTRNTRINRCVSACEESLAAHRMQPSLIDDSKYVFERYSCLKDALQPKNATLLLDVGYFID